MKKAIIVLAGLMLFCMIPVFSQDQLSIVHRGKLFSGVFYGPVGVTYIADASFAGSFTLNVPIGVNIDDSISVATMPYLSTSMVLEGETTGFLLYNSGLSAAVFVQDGAFVCSIDLPVLDISYSVSSVSGTDALELNSIFDTLRLNIGIGPVGYLARSFELRERICWMFLVGFIKTKSETALTVGLRAGVLN